MGETGAQVSMWASSGASAFTTDGVAKYLSADGICDTASGFTRTNRVTCEEGKEEDEERGRRGKRETRKEGDEERGK